MFQISKIVSVKKRDDGDGKYIEVFMTNRAASIKKKYQCGCDRDNAFVEVKKILNSIS